MQKIQLSIPKPCQQNWNEMTPTQQGRFCNSCAKQVVDFSTMSDTQVLNYFSGIKNENVCGRAYPDQLERAITMPKLPKKKLFWHWNYITMLFLFFSKTNHVKAQGGIKVVTVAQPDSNKSVSISSALAGRVGKIVSDNNQIISGKIIDREGNPIYFATVKIKGTNLTTASNVNGEYSIKVNFPNDILQISSVGYDTKEVALKGLKGYDFVMARMLMGDVVTVGIMIRKDEDYFPAANPKHIVVLEVKDNATLQPISKASVVSKRNGFYKTDSVLTDKKGIYKLRRVEEDEIFTVKISADGYKEEELQIKGYEFDERKIVKQIFLEKAPSVADYKKLDTVSVSSIQCTSRRTCTTGAVSSIMGAMISGVTITRTFTDSIKLITTKITGTLKISPNPVQKGNAFNLSLKLKQTGLYTIQIADAAGRIVLQKQITATAKDRTEQIQTDNRWSSGVYYVRVLGSNNKMISTGSLILQ